MSHYRKHDKELNKVLLKVQKALIGHEIKVCITALTDALATALAVSVDTPDQLDKFIDGEFSPTLKDTARGKLGAALLIQAKPASGIH